MTPAHPPTAEEREAQTRRAFGLFCAAFAMTLVCAGLVAFAGAPRFMLLLVGGLTIVGGVLILLAMLLDTVTGQSGPGDRP